MINYLSMPTDLVSVPPTLGRTFRPVRRKKFGTCGEKFGPLLNGTLIKEVVLYKLAQWLQISLQRCSRAVPFFIGSFTVFGRIFSKLATLSGMIRILNVFSSVSA
jgi:hypothetical protein